MRRPMNETVLSLSAIPDNERHVNDHAGLFDGQFTGVFCSQHIRSVGQFAGLGFIGSGDDVEAAQRSISIRAGRVVEDIGLKAKRTGAGNAVGKDIHVRQQIIRHIRQ